MSCSHSWVNTGLCRTWCRWCNADAYWKDGQVVIEKARMRTISVGLTCQFRDYERRWVYDGISVRVKDLKILPPYLRVTSGHWRGLGGQCLDASGKEVNNDLLENAEHVDLVTDKSYPDRIALEVAFENGFVAFFYIKLTETQIVAFTRELNALP